MHCVCTACNMYIGNIIYRYNPDEKKGTQPINQTNKQNINLLSFKLRRLVYELPISVFQRHKSYTITRE